MDRYIDSEVITMASAEQLKSLVKAHFENNEDKFKTTLLQIAAAEARQGHTTLARELKDIVDKAPNRVEKILSINNTNQMFLFTMPVAKITDLVVCEEIESRINRILLEFKQRDKLHRHGMLNRRKILLEGSPGTGKTLTASIIASELKLPLYIVQMDKLVTKYMGETSIKLRQIFDTINDSLGVYLFDEFDAIGTDRSYDNDVGEMRRVLNSFLQFIEQDLSDSIIIAATNNRKLLDQALFRRFDDVLHYDLPSEHEIVKLFNIKLGEFIEEITIDETLLQNAKKLSHAEITRACNDAIKTVILKNQKLNNKLLNKMLTERYEVYHDKEA